MATFTLSSVADQFPVGTSVGAYLAKYRRDGSSPSGTATATATVASAGSLTFTGLAHDTDYVAYASVNGAYRYRNFSTDRPTTTRVEIVGTPSQGDAPVWNSTAEAWVSTPAVAGVSVEVIATEEGIVGDGTTDDSDAIIAAFAEYAGERAIRFPRGEYRITKRITIPSGLEVIRDEGAVFLVDDVDAASGTAMFYGAGTDGTKTNLDASTAAGAETVVLPAGYGAGFSVGDIIGFESTDEVTGVSIAIRARELRRVEKIATDTVTLDAPLHYAYTTGDTAKFWKITPLSDVKLDVVFEMGDNVTPGTDKSYCIRLEKCVDSHVDAKITNGVGGVMFVDAVSCTTGRVRINGLPSFSDAYGYGVVLVGACHDITINGLRGRHCRHVFTTLYEQRTGPLYYTGPQHVSINQARGYGDAESYAIFDCHQGAKYLEYNECVAIGGGNTGDGIGFQDRSDDVTYNNCRAIRCKGGARVTSDAARATFNGGEYAYSKTTGGGIGTSGPNTKVIGANCHDNGGPGIAATASTATDLLVAACSLTENGTYGVQLATTTPRPVVMGNFIPEGTGGLQTVAVLNASADATIAGNVATGYGTGNPFSGAQAGAKIHDNTTDGPITVTAATTMGLISGNQVHLTTGATTIDNITADGWGGRVVTLKIGTAVSIRHNGGGTGNLRLSGGSDFSAGVDDTLTLACVGTVWHEVSRTVI